MAYIVQIVTRKGPNTKWWGSVYPNEAKELGETMSTVGTNRMGRLELKPVNDNNTYILRMFFKDKEIFDEFWQLYSENSLYKRQQEYNHRNGITTEIRERIVSREEQLMKF